MTDLALLRCHSRPIVALGLDLRSLRMELAHISHHQDEQDKTQAPSSSAQICSRSRAQAGTLAAF